MRRPRDVGQMHRCGDSVVGRATSGGGARCGCGCVVHRGEEIGRGQGARGGRAAAVKTEGGRESSLGFEMWLLYGGGDLSGRQRAF
jgi:hypothetical protein